MFRVPVFIVAYAALLTLLSSRFTSRFRGYSCYTMASDTKEISRSSVIFDREFTRETSRKFTNDTEKCEWALEKLKDLFQFFLVADNTIWPYQVILAVLGALFMHNMFKTKATFQSMFSIVFFLFVFIDLPRRFLSFHRNAEISNKALDIFTFYYKNMKGKNTEESDILNF